MNRKGFSWVAMTQKWHFLYSNKDVKSEVLYSWQADAVAMESIIGRNSFNA